MRLGRELPHVGADAIGIGDGTELRLPIQLGRGIRARKPGERRRLLRFDGDGTGTCREQRDSAGDPRIRW